MCNEPRMVQPKISYEVRLELGYWNHNGRRAKGVEVIYFDQRRIDALKYIRNIERLVRWGVIDRWVQKQDWESCDSFDRFEGISGLYKVERFYFEQKIG